jgi:hypothetical protein
MGPDKVAGSHTDLGASQAAVHLLSRDPREYKVLVLGPRYLGCRCATEQLRSKRNISDIQSKDLHKRIQHHRGDIDIEASSRSSFIHPAG